MNSRERIFRTIKKHEITDRIPWLYLFGATQAINPRLMKRYKEHLGWNGYLHDYFDFDIINVNCPEKTGSNFVAGCVPLKPNGISPADYYDVPNLPKGFIDAWGVYNIPWQLDPTFETYINPLREADEMTEFEAYPSPSVDEAVLPELADEAASIRAKGKMSSIYAGSLYEWCGVLRGQEELMIDMHLNPVYVEALLEKVASVTESMCLAAVRSGIDIISCYDDFGAQQSLQISPEHWRRYIKPGWKRIWESVRRLKSDAIIFLHSCGCIEAIMPDLIELGLDVLHPIQPETMDVHRISDLYQRDIAIWGTVSCQQTIPFGSPAQVDAEVRDRMETLGKKGGFILSPANIIGPEVPIANLDAFANAAIKYG